MGSFNVRVPGLITNPADVYSLPIKTDGNTVVTFGDVAHDDPHLRGRDQLRPRQRPAGHHAGVIKKLGTNVISVSDDVRKTTDEFTKDWPQGLAAQLPARPGGIRPRACSARSRRRC